MDKRNQRRSYFVNKEVQLQFAGLLVFVFVLTGIQLVSSIFLINSNLEQEAATYGLDADPVVLSFIIVQQKSILFKLFVYLGINMLLVGLFGLIFSHRLTGPVFHMNRFLKKVTVGELDNTLVLRKTDQFHEMAKTINEMVRTFREKRTQQLEHLNSLEKIVSSNGGSKDALSLIKDLQRQCTSSEDAATIES